MAMEKSPAPAPEKDKAEPKKENQEAQDAPLTAPEYDGKASGIKDSLAFAGQQLIVQLGNFHPAPEDQKELKTEVAKNLSGSAEDEALLKILYVQDKDSVGRQVIATLSEKADKIKAALDKVQNPMDGMKVEVLGNDSGTVGINYKNISLGMSDILNAGNLVFGYQYDGESIRVAYTGNVRTDGSSGNSLQVDANFNENLNIVATLKLNTVGTGGDLSIEDYEAALKVKLPLNTTVAVESSRAEKYRVSFNAEGRF